MLAAFNETYLNHLKQVTTRAQAARDYGVHTSTVQLWIDCGRIAADKVGGVWIISLPSLRAYRGAPTRKTA